MSPIGTKEEHDETHQLMTLHSYESRYTIVFRKQQHMLACWII